MKPTEFDLQVIEIICAFRKLKNEKQSNFASLLHITQPEYSRIEKGERALTVGHLQIICNYLGLSLSKFISIAEGLSYKSNSTPDLMVLMNAFHKAMHTNSDKKQAELYSHPIHVLI